MDIKQKTIDSDRLAKTQWQQPDLFQITSISRTLGGICTAVTESTSAGVGAPD